MNELLKRLWAAQSRAERPPGGEIDTVYMHGIITDETTQDDYRRYFNDDRTISVISVLKQLSEISGDTVRLNINSPGGNYFEGAAIRDTLLADGRELVAVGAGMVGSAATLPFFAAGRRELADGGMIMIHQPASGVYEMGTADEIEKAAMAVVRGLRAMSVTVAQIYSTATGGKTKAKRFGELMTAETMFSPQEALELGLVQSVITPNQPTNKEGDMEKTKLIATLGLPDDVSDEDLETAVAAMKQRDDQAQSNQQTNDATAAFDTAMSVPLSQGKVTPTTVETLRGQYDKAENQEAFLAVQKATLQALPVNSAFPAKPAGSGLDPTGGDGDPENKGDEGGEDGVIVRVQARVDKHTKAGMSVTQAMIAAKNENPEEFEKFRNTGVDAKEFARKGKV